jgi:hypothetical protein
LPHLEAVAEELRRGDVARETIRPLLGVVVDADVLAE